MPLILILFLLCSTICFLAHRHYSRVIYNAQHPHHQLHRLPHGLSQSSDRSALYGTTNTNDFATYQNYASTASTVSTLAQFNYNNPESYPYTPTTPPTTATDISATTPTNRLELSASALAQRGGGVGRTTQSARGSKDGDGDGEQFASVRIQVGGRREKNENDGGN